MTRGVVRRPKPLAGTDQSRLYLPAGTTAQGPFDLVITPESAGWGYSSLRVVTLAPGQSIEFDTGSDEMIVLPLTGGAEVTIGETTFRLAGRESVFTGVTDTAYLPIDIARPADQSPMAAPSRCPGPGPTGRCRSASSRRPRWTSRCAAADLRPGR